MGKSSRGWIAVADKQPAKQPVTSGHKRVSFVMSTSTCNASIITVYNAEALLGQGMCASDSRQRTKKNCVA